MKSRVHHAIWRPTCYLCRDARRRKTKGHWSKDHIPLWVCDECWRARPLEHDGCVNQPTSSITFGSANAPVPEGTGGKD